MSMKSSHVPFDRLADLAEGRLEADEQRRARAHLAVCARCAADAAWLERTTRLMRADDSEDAPAHVVARAVRLFRPRVADPAPSLRERIVAALTFDSGQAPLAFGVRAAQTMPRQLLYTAGEQELDLRLTPVGDRWIVAGQILGPSAGGRVALTGPAGASEAPIDDLGEFTLPPVLAGDYALQLQIGDADIEVAGLRIGA